MRSSARLIFVLPAIIAMAAPAFLGQKRSLAGAIFAVTAFIGFMISTIIPMGLRTDLQHVDALKSLPVSSGAIVWGSMASAVLYPTLLQIAIVVVLSAVGGEWSWASTAAVCFALPINLLLTSGDSVLVLLYPSTRRFAPGDFLAGMRLTLSYVIKMLFVMLALGVAGLGMAPRLPGAWRVSAGNVRDGDTWLAGSDGRRAPRPSGLPPGCSAVSIPASTRPKIRKRPAHFLAPPRSRRHRPDGNPRGPRLA